MSCASVWKTHGQDVRPDSGVARPLRRPVRGTYDSLSAMTVEEVKSFVKRHYTPGNCIIVISDNFELTPSERCWACGQRRFRSVPRDRAAAQLHRVRV